MLPVSRGKKKSRSAELLHTNVRSIFAALHHFWHEKNQIVTSDTVYWSPVNMQLLHSNASPLPRNGKDNATGVNRFVVQITEKESFKSLISPLKCISVFFHSLKFLEKSILYNAFHTLVQFRDTAIAALWKLKSARSRLQHTYFISTGFQQTLLNSKLHDLVIFILHMYVPAIILDMVRFGNLKHRLVNLKISTYRSQIQFRNIAQYVFASC